MLKIKRTLEDTSSYKTTISEFGMVEAKREEYEGITSLYEY